MLDADRQAHHVLGDAGLPEFLGRQLPMRRAGRMTGERLGVADVHEPGEQLEGVLDPRAGIAAAVHAEGEDARGASAHVAVHERLRRRIGQAGVVDPPDLRMRPEVAGDLECVGADAVHAHRQRLDALQDQEGVERREGRAHVPERHHARPADVGGRSQRLGEDHAVIGHVRRVQPRELVGVPGPGEVAGVDEQAADTVAVPAEILGERVHDDVGAVVERPAQVGRGDRVVDDQRDAVPVGDIGQRRDIGDVAQWIADRLAVDRPRVRVDQLLEGGRVPVVREARADAVLRQRMGEQVVGAAVERGARDQVLARLHDGQQRVRDRRLARRQRQPADAAFQRGHARLEHGIGGVHDARVDVALDLEVEQVRGVLRVVEGVGRRLVDRHRDRLGGRVGAVAGMDGEGLGAHGVSCSWVGGEPKVAARRAAPQPESNNHW